MHTKTWDRFKREERGFFAGVYKQTDTDTDTDTDTPTPAPTNAHDHNHTHTHALIQNHTSGSGTFKSS